MIKTLERNDVEKLKNGTLSFIGPFLFVDNLEFITKKDLKILLSKRHKYNILFAFTFEEVLNRYFSKKEEFLKVLLDSNIVDTDLGFDHFLNKSHAEDIWYSLYTENNIIKKFLLKRTEFLRKNKLYTIADTLKDGYFVGKAFFLYKTKDQIRRTIKYVYDLINALDYEFEISEGRYKFEDLFFGEKFRFTVYINTFLDISDKVNISKLYLSGPNSSLFKNIKTPYDEGFNIFEEIRNMTQKTDRMFVKFYETFLFLEDHFEVGKRLNIKNNERISFSFITEKYNGEKDIITNYINILFGPKLLKYYLPEKIYRAFYES